jgi:hypothetical protein
VTPLKVSVTHRRLVVTKSSPRRLCNQARGVETTFYGGDLMRHVTCTIPDCGRPYVAKGYCEPHYRRFTETGDPLSSPIRTKAKVRPRCVGPDCDHLQRYPASGLCRAHYLQQWHGKELRPLRKQLDSRTRDDQGRKKCFHCREWLPESAYRSGARTYDGLYPECLDCSHDQRLRRTYGITAAVFDAMLAAQGGGCSICGGQSDVGRRLCVDHDHSCCPGLKSCGKCVRGLLCNSCNRAIGLLGDDPERVRKVISYLTGQLL